MNDRHRFRVFDKQIGKYVTNNLLLITSQSWLYVDGKCVSLEEPDRYIIEFCTGLSASKSYRGDKPEDLLIWEGDVLEWTEIQIMDGTEIKHQVYIEFRGNGFGTTHMDGKPDGMIWSPTCYEIIGTIHDEEASK